MDAPPTVQQLIQDCGHTDIEVAMAAQNTFCDAITPFVKNRCLAHMLPYTGHIDNTNNIVSPSASLNMVYLRDGRIMVLERLVDVFCASLDKQYALYRYYLDFILVPNPKVHETDRMEITAHLLVDSWPTTDQM